MDRIKEANKILKIYPKLKLGEKIVVNGKPGGVKSTGIHLIKIIAEPTTTMVKKTVDKNEVLVKGFKFIVEEKGQLFKWLVPMTDPKTNEGHYLMEHLQDIEVGEEFTVEMKKEQGRNYIEVKRLGAKAPPAGPSTDDDVEEVPHYNREEGEEEPPAGAI